MLKSVLHITNWHPNRDNPYEAIWMQRHVESLKKHCYNEVWHIQVRLEKKLKWHKYKDQYDCQHRILDLPFNKWFICEIFTFLILAWYLLFVIRKKNFDLINFHIAYPLLCYPKLVKFFAVKPIVITEHWSAYHFNFGLPKETTKLNRIKKIFRHNFPLITVSKALADDIAIFSGYRDKNTFIVPNVVDIQKIDQSNTGLSSKPDLNFFMLGGWTYPKKPIIIISAFADFLISNPNAKLNIGGKGPMLDDMQKAVKEHNIADHVNFLGQLNSKEIAIQLSLTDFFLHASDYETFSVVCAEALCYGVPVIASRVGGIKEYLDDKNGILVSDNVAELWLEALISIKDKNFDPKMISEKAVERFGIEAVGSIYYNSLNLILNDFQ